MAKSSTAVAVSPVKKRGFDEWEVREAMRTMMRAGEIVKDKKLLEAVRKEAQKHAAELEATAKQAGQLAKMGRISPKQMAKLGSR